MLLNPLPPLAGVRQTHAAASGRTVLWCTLVLMGCHQGPASDSPARTTPPSQGALLPQTTNPDNVLARFLLQVVATRKPTQAGLDSVFVRGDEGDWETSHWLADYEIGSTLVQGDSAIVTAAITTVAREYADPTFQPGESGPPFRALAELRTRTDTAIFNLVVRNGHWVVVGHGRWGSPKRDPISPQVDLFRVAKIHRWTSVGASAERATALIDSIRTARGHPVVR